MGIQDGAQDFVGSKQMTEISARIAAADHAAATFVDRPRIADEFGILDMERPLARVEIAVSRIARWQHAIHHIDAAANVIH